MRRGLFAAASITWIAFGAGCGEGEVIVDGWNRGPMSRAFDEAAAESGIPSDLLKSVAYVQSGFEMAEGAADLDGHGRRGYGPMQLAEDPDLDTVGLAAELLGVSREAVKTDPVVNIRGGAMVLRRFADETLGARVPTGADPGQPQQGPAGADLADYREALMKFTGSADPEVAGGFADQVLDVLRDGAGVTTSTGEAIEIHPALPPSEFGSRQQALTGDSGMAARFIAASSSNYTVGRGGNPVRYVVIHTTEGSYWGAISWFQNPRAQAAAHYVVRSSDGEITQMVREADTGWHAGNWTYNQRSVGIEHEAWAGSGAGLTEALYRSSAKLTCNIVRRHGLPIDRTHIIGHVEVPNQSHWDPGRHFRWDYYIGLVRSACNQAPPPPPTGRGTLQGVIYKAPNTGDRVAGAAVRLSNGAATTTDANGYYTFRVEPGDYTVTATVAGFQTGSVRRSVSAGAEVWGSIGLVAAPTTGTLTGIVHEAGDPARRIAGARVTLSNGRSDAADSTGRYAIASPGGAVTARVEAIGFVAASFSRTIVVGQTVEVNVALSRPTTVKGTLKGVVYVSPDSSQRIGGGRVSVAGVGSVTADGSGYFEFALAPGTYTVSATASGYTSASVVRSVVSGQGVWGSVGLSRLATGTLVGVIYRSPDSSQRIAGAQVTVSGDAGTFKTTSDASGVYRLTIPSGGYTIRAVASGYAPNSVTRTVAASTTTWGSVPLSP